jgi:hypothetical protein
LEEGPRRQRAAALDSLPTTWVALALTQHYWTLKRLLSKLEALMLLMVRCLGECSFLLVVLISTRLLPYLKAMLGSGAQIHKYTTLGIHHRHINIFCKFFLFGVLSLFVLSKPTLVSLTMAFCEGE